jgi:GDP-L-fucose synthase
MEKNARIFVAGHRGMVGSAIVRNLKAKGFENIITRTSSELDLRNQQDTTAFFEAEKPEYVFMAAAKVGGIVANNTYRAEFIHDNLAMEINVIHQAYLNNVKKLLFLGSSCIYPKLAPQPLTEDSLLSGFLEPTNEPYAIAKIAGIKMCEAYSDQYGCNFISAMPTNLYGTNDNYHPENSHVIPALIRKFVAAADQNLPEVEIWGTGKVFREFLHADDAADACVFLMNNYNEKQFVNVGSGTDITIAELASLIAELTGFSGNLRFNSDKPDGTPKKLMSNLKLSGMGWNPAISLKEGLAKTIKEFRTLEPSALNGS